MTPARTTRKLAFAIIALIWILVCGGLAWATKLAIRMEAIEETSKRKLDAEIVRAQAISRLDLLIEDLIGPERNRSYDHYRAYYKPAEVRNQRDGSEISGQVVVPSPLRTQPNAKWFLLHFQASELLGWSSPQVRETGDYPRSAAFFDRSDRPRHARPENWLTALRERYKPSDLIYMVEQAQDAEYRRRQPGPAASAPAAPPAESPAPAQDSDPAAHPLARVLEFAQRGARLLQVQREQSPADSCEPETVALENLELAEGVHSADGAPIRCVQVSKTPMFPVWLDLTLDKQVQLALVRSASVETGNFCALQGVLLDWDQLRDTLEKEVRYLIPQARIVPVLPNTVLAKDARARMLQSIPAMLEAGSESPHVADASLSRALKIGLSVAWITTVLALSAISYSILKFVSMTERRMRFVSAVSHELRTPLTSFQLYSDLLADMPGEDAQRRRTYAGTLRGEARRLSRLVENVLAYSRLGGAAPQIHRAATPPRAILDAVAASMADRCAAAGKHLVLVDDCPPDTRIDTDREFVEQILANLVENACKYSLEATDPSIWLSVSAVSGDVVFEVEDGGRGVPPADRRLVFEPFRRSDHAGNGAGGGIGLGLTMSRYWAGCLGGRLTVRKGARNPEAFACFSLQLPRGLDTAPHVPSNSV